MVISNEKLALLYNETEDRKNKQKIFLELKNNLEKKTLKIVHFFIKNFSKQHKKYDDYKNYMQLADMILVSTLNMFMGTNNKFILEKWYTERLKNEIYDINKNRVEKENDISMDFQLEHLDNVISVIDNNYDSLDTHIDNSFLYDIIKTYIDKMSFYPKGNKDSNYYKEIFIQSIGFNEERQPKSYAELARINNCTRQNIRDCCTRYMDNLKKLLKEDNKLEELRQYL